MKNSDPAHRLAEAVGGDKRRNGCGVAVGDGDEVDVETGAAVGRTGAKLAVGASDVEGAGVRVAVGAAIVGNAVSEAATGMAGVALGAFKPHPAKAAITHTTPAM